MWRLRVGLGILQISGVLWEESQVLSEHPYPKIFPSEPLPLLIQKFSAESESDFPAHGCVPVSPVLKSESDPMDTTCPGFKVMVEVKIPVPSSFIRESSINERRLMDSIPSE
jgi:hypothetical protein